MLGTSYGPFLYMAAVILAGGFFGHWLMRRSRRRTLVMLTLAHVFGGIALFGAAQNAGDASAAMGYYVFLFLLVLPSFLGLGLGAALGWWRGPVQVAD